MIYGRYITNCEEHMPTLVLSSHISLVRACERCRELLESMSFMQGMSLVSGDTVEVTWPNGQKRTFRYE